MPAVKTAVGYELRVTTRCLLEDLAFRESDVSTDPALLAAGATSGAGLLRTFIETRSKAPVPSDEDIMNGMAEQAPPTYPLRRGHRQRGLTWYDHRNKVVWLVAAHHSHRSGETDDSYRYFRSLRREDLLPSREDMERMLGERRDEIADQIWDDLPNLMRAAAAQPGTEVTGHIGRVPVAMVMTADLPPHLYLAVSRKWETVGVTPPAKWLLGLLFRCYGHSYEDVEQLPLDRAMPHRAARNEDIYSDFVSDWPRPRD